MESDTGDKNMKIGIYNPNLSTMGGGEKVCVALAEVLSSGNDVLLVTYETVEKEKLESYFGTNLQKTQIETNLKSKSHDANPSWLSNNATSSLQH